MVAAADAPTISTAESGDMEAYCQALSDLQSGAVVDLATLQQLYDQLEANAPVDLRSDVQYFTTHARLISEAFSSSDEDAETILSSLDQETRDFVLEMTAAASGEGPSSGPFYEVMNSKLSYCGR